MTEPPISDGDSTPIDPSTVQDDGRDAPEAPAWVAELLRSLPSDDPPIPDDVASRLDAVLATLAAGRAAASPPGAVHSSATADSADAGPGATVVPIQSATGRPRSNGQTKRSPLGWVGGLAAAALVVVGGTAIVHNMGSASSSAGPAAVPVGPNTASITPQYVASGIGYTPKALTDQVHALLTRAGISGKSPVPSTRTTTSEPTTESSAPSAGATHNSVGELQSASAKPTRDCLTDLSGSPTAEPLVVDEATYAGAKVFVVVFQTTGSTGTVDVWVVKPTCNGTDSALIKFARADR